MGYVTSDTLWGEFAWFDAIPNRLVVLGGEPNGCELLQGFQRLGAQVTQIGTGPRMMRREDEEVSALAGAAKNASVSPMLAVNETIRVAHHKPKRAPPASVKITAPGVESAVAMIKTGR